MLRASQERSAIGWTDVLLVVTRQRSRWAIRLIRMDRIRHFLAVLGLVSYVPGLCFWFLIHPLARFWRRVGPALTYTSVLLAMAVIGVVVYQVRGALLGRDFGTNRVFIAVGGGWLSMLAWLGFTFGRHMDHLTMATRMGIPELSKVDRPEAFVHKGMYRVVRHPIYASGAAGGIGYALIVNHLGIYILVVFAIPVLYVATLLEEHELVDRFGEAYRQYQREVPRLLPGWKRD
jgi:protein-S-isoprenylcysteine O-methyltransferase Ste14